MHPGKDFLLAIKIKNKIKTLLDKKKVKKSRLSVELGYNKHLLTTILYQKDKFFNLNHIEKICAALEYPVARLFEDDQEEQASPALGQEKTLLEIFRGLSRAHKLDVISFAGGRRLAEAPPPKASKKDSAAALGESGERYLKEGKI